MRCFARSAALRTGLRQRGSCADGETALRARKTTGAKAQIIFEALIPRLKAGASTAQVIVNNRSTTE